LDGKIKDMFYNRGKMCNHNWRKVYEENLFGGVSLIGWECAFCDEYHDINSLTPEGLSGTILKNSAHLHAPCGGQSKTSSGKLYREQFADEDGNITIK
jgi:hypothetical protein